MMRVLSPIKKTQNLPPERLNEVEDFVEFIAERDGCRLILGATSLSEESFRKVWDNEEDAAYDNL